jgi:hypothetical protein
MSEATRSKRGAPVKPTAPPKGIGQNGAVSKSRGRKPSRPVPTDRIPFERQLSLLRAHVIASGEERRPVRNSDVAKVADYSETTLSQANAFFVDIGFLIRTPEGFIPSDEVRAFSHAYKWNQSTAGTKLAPVLERSWAGEALLPRLQFKDIAESDAIAALSEEVGVGPEYRGQLELLIEYMKECELVRVDVAGMLSIVHAEDRDDLSPEADDEEVELPSEAPEIRTSARSSRRDATPSNVLNLSVDIHVPMEDLNKWSAERITAFFAGVAAVLAAKNGGEKTTTKND